MNRRCPNDADRGSCYNRSWGLGEGMIRDSIAKTDLAHIRRMSWIFVAACAVVCGCEPAPAGSSIQNGTGTHVEYGEALMQRALLLAEEEFARFAATELVYRNQTETQETILPIIGSRVGATIKMYREFTGYEIVDILRTNSMLYPIEIVVRYDYDVLTTKVRGLGTPDAVSVTDADHEFDTRWKGSFTHRYKCDGDGTPLGETLELPRVNFYSREIVPNNANTAGATAIRWTEPPARSPLR